MKLLLIAILYLIPDIAQAAHVKGYVDKHGRVVPPHDRSNPDKSKENNYGRYPNTNPYTGKQGK